MDFFRDFDAGAGGIPPHGLKVICKRFEIDETEAPAIRIMFNRFAEGYSYKQIIDELTELGYYTRSGKPFNYSSIHDLLRNEIRAWCDNPNHEPKPVKLKTIHDYKDKLKTVSFKHFIWNIAARLGFENGYSGKIQADFIKSLVPNELKDVESKSLERSLTCSPDDGHIKLDRPKHTDNYIFHF